MTSYLRHRDQRCEKADHLGMRTLKDHTFRHRAGQILERIRELATIARSNEGHGTAAVH